MSRRVAAENMRKMFISLFDTFNIKSDTNSTPSKF